MGDEQVREFGLVTAVTIGVIALSLSLNTVFWYYVGNFILEVFDIVYTITWGKAFCISITMCVLSNIFRGGNN